MIRFDTSQPHNYPQWQTSPGTIVGTLTCDSAGRRTRFEGEPFGTRDWSDPLDAIDWMSRAFGNALSNGRWVGQISYDLGRLFEKIPSISIDDLNFPLFEFSLCDPKQKQNVEEQRDYSTRDLPRRSTLTRPAYIEAVERAIEYVRAGDVFQVNLSQRYSEGLREQPSAIYQRLRTETPALFGALFETRHHALICNSPELFLHVWIDPKTGKRRIRTRPIKGTRPRMEGADRELFESVKDQAELNMIVDLERNDLGRICAFGTVRVTQPRTIEAHPTVFHGVATVEGVLRDDVTFLDILRATFPGGSITGAPKVRAMEIIEALEPVRRGPYCGAIGYLAADGSMMFNIAIRTMIVKDGIIHIPVGGGIVADSDPQAEYEETLVKAKAMFDAVGVRSEDFTS